MDSGERKKRKKDGDAESAAATAFEGEEEENEDEKMEKFFALIRSTRDVKERLSNMAAARPTTATGNHNVDRSKGKPPPPPVAVWYPTFQPEDFMEDRPEPPDHLVESSSNRAPPPPDLNIDINPNTTHEGKQEATTEAAGPSSSYKTGEYRDDDDDDNHGLDLKLSL
ncbi:OLC1v1038646C1 [Oldenlandia corymbosa var. corymbosa]|uniref:OLC1v1038646C1 n=1 Tax=Oldenlandia corymbosa var. corymbosa TaxID=529605 RepID=A0AAV1D0Y1_OLDCO|nr:OLC1v1038646C1 [Oldenlandia corymbosa var. corymbosa]